MPDGVRLDEAPDGVRRQQPRWFRTPSGTISCRTLSDIFPEGITSFDENTTFYSALFLQFLKSSSNHSSRTLKFFMATIRKTSDIPPKMAASCHT